MNMVEFPIVGISVWDDYMIIGESLCSGEKATGSNTSSYSVPKLF